MIAATVESWLADNPNVKLPHRGTILLAFGAIVTVTGLYNSVREYLKRRADSQSP